MYRVFAGPNRSAIEVLQRAGHELRQLGVRQTPIVKEPLEPQHLGLRAFLTFQPALFVSAPSPGGDAEDLHRSIAEAVRTTLEAMKEGRPMQMTMTPGQATFGEQLYGGVSPWTYQGGFGQQMSLPFSQGIQPYEIAQITATVTPIVLSLLQSRALHGLGGQHLFGGQHAFGAVPFGGYGGGYGGGFGGPWGGQYGPLAPHAARLGPS